MSFTVLAIETSCDETAAAVVQLQDAPPAGGLPQLRLRSNVVHSQQDQHALYGGVVPEVASREHLAKLQGLVRQAVAPVGGLAAIDGIAVSRGPGLVGALLVGVQLAKGLALALERPWLGIHHLEGHLCAALLTERPPSFPHLALIASGGHTQFVAVRAFGDYALLGGTRDDAAGEAFDKGGKLLGLGYPAGAAVDALAQTGDPTALRLPRALPKDDAACSFSGVKSALARHLAQAGPPTPRRRADLCASLQQAICEVLVNKALRLAVRHRLPGIVVAGGVAANSLLRRLLAAGCEAAGLWHCAPPLQLCTDNAAMVGAAGALRLAAGERSAYRLSVRARWPLAELRPPAPSAAPTQACS